MNSKRILAAVSIVAPLTLFGCGGGGGNGGGGGGLFALTDSSGFPITGSRALPSNHGINSSVQGFGPYDQAAFEFTGPAGATETPPYGLPSCSYYSIYTVDKNGALPSQLISPRLPAGSYTLKIYDLKGSGATRQVNLKSTSSLTVADSPANVPTTDVGLLSAGAFSSNDSFTPGSDVYVRGTGFPAGQTVDVYITAHKTSWATNDALIDVSGTIANAPPTLPDGTKAAHRAASPPRTRALQGTAKTITTDANGRFGPLLAWQNVGSEADQRLFDVIVDANRTGRFDPAHDLIIDESTGSFGVDSINRAASKTRAGGGNNVTMAYDQNMVLSTSFSQLDNVRTMLSTRTVQPTQLHAAFVMVCKHKASWQQGDRIIDASGPNNTTLGNIVPIVNNRLTVPPIYAYHADLLPGDYDIVVNPGISTIYDPSRDFIDGGSGSPSFTVTGTVPHKKWTVMVYLDGDNSLNQDAMNNFLEMESVTYRDSSGNSDVNVALQYADNKAKTKRYIVAHSTDSTRITTNPISDLGEVNMADTNTLSQFIAWAKQASPADHYALILWDHGTGFTSKAARRGLTRNIIWSDTFHNRSLTVSDVHDVLKQSGPFDLVACDACLMGMTEVAYELRDVCSVFNGSEDLEPGHGYDYKAFLTDLVANPNMTAVQLGTSVVNAYKAYFTANSANPIQPTCTCVDESKIAAVSTALDGVVNSLTSVPPGGTQSVLASVTNRQTILNMNYWKFQSPEFKYADAMDWIAQLKAANFNSSVGSACDTAMSAYSDAIIAEYHALGQTRAHGLTLWVPNQSNFDSFSDEYNDLQFAKDSKWVSFLELLLKSGSKILPINTVLDDHVSQLFTASTPDTVPSGSSLLYRWSTTGLRGQLMDSHGNTANSFQTTSNTMSYVPYLGQSGTETVTVHVLIVTGLQKADLGPADATVTVTKRDTITGQAEPLIYTKSNSDGTVTLYGFYTFSITEGAYAYGLSGGAGTIGITDAEIHGGAPVVSQGQDLTAAMAYHTTFPAEANLFFNLGGGKVGVYVYPGGFPPARIPPSNLPTLKKSLQDFFDNNPTTVNTYF